jgi:hypothetical protein
VRYRSAAPGTARVAADLAAQLDRAARAMAPRIPLAETAARLPVTVVLEPDFVAQAGHAGVIGEAVVNPVAGLVDLYVVHHPDDLFAERQALARVLLGRAGLDRAPGPGWLPEGAALWLSRDWYGRTWADWMPRLAAARVLPSAADLLPAEGDRQPAASRVLWTPAAAAVVERLPGATLAEKLREAPGRERVAAILAQMTRMAAEAPPVQPLPRTAAAKAALPFLKGVSLAMLNRVEGGYHAPAIDRQLQRLRGLGASSVSLMPFAFQPGPDSPDLAYLNRHPGSETDVGLIHAARRARAQGFTVLYKPHIWVSRDSWPGDVEMKSEADWAAWWERYRRYVLHHAILAGWSKSELFSVGVELSKTVRREKEWRDLIAAVRLVYPGRVTYSGNWYGDLEGVRFWGDLDLIGIDAYYPLAAAPDAAPAALRQGARTVVERLAAAARREKKPLLLTEVGFAAQRGAWVHPHTEGGEYSEADQARAYEALFKELGRPRWLAGTFVWKAFSAELGETGEGRAGRADFRFLGRAAEAVIRRYYTGMS